MLLIVALVLLLLIFLYAKHQKGDQESWQTYIRSFFIRDTGRDPLYFYQLVRYRKPYRWPFQFYKSYPYPHMSYYEGT